MKKILLLAAVLMTFLCTTAWATPFAVRFDADGTGTDAQVQDIWGWDLEGIAEDEVLGVAYNLVTHQTTSHTGDAAPTVLGNNDEFYEDFTVALLNGLASNYDPVDTDGDGQQSDNGGYYNYLTATVSANLFIDVHLEGYITDYLPGSGPATTASNPTAITNDSYTSIFNTTTSSARLYVDGNGNSDWDDAVTDLEVATYSLDAAGSFILTPSVFSGVGAQVSFAFSASSLNSDFFSQATGHPDPIALSGLYLTVAQGGVALTGGPEGDLTADPDEILLGFQETGFDAKFEYVPEPATMLLFGLGLLSVAGISRRKNS